MSKRLLAVLTCRKFSYAPQDTGAAHHNGPNERIQAILDTWYARWLCRYADQIDLRFFVGRGEVRPDLPNLIELDCGDDYRSLPEKVQKACSWAYIAGYDEFAKIDDDVAVNLANLLADTTFSDYRGFEVEADYKYASGTFYWFSRRAMGLVAEAEWKPEEHAEDRWVGKIMLDNGIPLVHDPRFLCCSCDACLERYDKDSLISIHTTSPKQMYSFMEK